MIDREAVSLEGQVAVVTGAAKGIGEATAIVARANFGARRRDLRPRRRRHGRRPRTRSQRPGSGASDRRARRPRHRRGERVGSPSSTASTARSTSSCNNAGGTFYADFFDTNAKGERMLVDENFTSVTNFVRGLRAPDAGRRIHRQRDVDRGPPRRARFRHLRGHEGGGREPDPDARARARTPPHPREHDRARRHPDVGRRGERRGRRQRPRRLRQEGAARLGNRRRLRRPHRLPRQRPVALHERHDAARRRRQPRRQRLGPPPRRHLRALPPLAASPDRRGLRLRRHRRGRRPGGLRRLRWACRRAGCGRGA